ncbi:hypothetical protein J437_LFUL019271 [Ladona fulva]|uniref:Transposase n=1 Tax=Ladona fulva TaxID=123851 RepID=A0A8K0KGE1_LADFU|nr:hypothetical protein J437_LFUL019271 [Ladona fulva]
MVWGAIGYNTRSLLLRIEGNRNSNRYITDVLELVALPLLHEAPDALFQQDNARPHVARNVQASSKNDRYHCFPGLQVHMTCSPSNMSAIWSICNFYAVVLLQQLWMIYGCAYKLHDSVFLSNISRRSLILCYEVQRLRLQHVDASHRTEFSRSECM